MLPTQTFLTVNKRQQLVSLKVSLIIFYYNQKGGSIPLGIMRSSWSAKQIRQNGNVAKYYQQFITCLCFFNDFLKYGMLLSNYVLL